jgi:hypothetical protein
MNCQARFSRRVAKLGIWACRADLPGFGWNIRLVAAMLGLLCLGSGGCVERRMTIRSNPPGALVYVDDYEVGVTPISTSFIYYGSRKIRLVKDGYETLTVIQPIPPPWYEYFPADFVAENFVPGQIRDQRILDFQLKPQTVVPTEQLRMRAEQLRRGVHASAGIVPTPMPTPMPVATGTVRPTSPPGAMVPQPNGNVPAANSPAAGMQSMPNPQGIGSQPLYPLPSNGQ